MKLSNKPRRQLKADYLLNMMKSLRKRKIILCISICIVLFGCSTKWHHPDGFGKERRNSDRESCKVQAYKYATDRLSDPAHPKGEKDWKFAFKVNYEIHFHECMKGKGWKLAYYNNDGLNKRKTDDENCKLEAMKYSRDKLFDPSHPKEARGWPFDYKVNWTYQYNRCMDGKGW